MRRLRVIKDFYNKYERYLIPGALVFGFVTDILTFRFLNFPLAMSLLAFHLIFIGSNITVINLYESKKIAGKFFSYWRVGAPLFLQYSFGNMFSAFLIFYSHSGSFFASWPFIITIIFLMIGNEIFRKYNIRPSIQISIYFFALFSYLNILLPNLLKDITPTIFIASGVVSFIYILLFTILLVKKTFTVKEKKKVIVIAVSTIYILMNVFYFFNLIPPIPLSIKDIGVYHKIERYNDNYRVVTEDCGSILSCAIYHETRSIPATRQKIFFYSAVYAPDTMNLDIVHEWQKYSYKNKRWETSATIPFTVQGGRDIGYRWYTFYTVTPGYWRVNVKTKRGQTVGRKNFYIIEGNLPRKQIVI